MSPIELGIPKSVRANVRFNLLYPVSERGNPPENIVLVALPEGYFIDVGFYPDEGANGSYRVTVYQGEWDNQRSEDWLSDPQEVAKRIPELALQFSGQTIAETPKSLGAT
jgi:hypothetical protein